MTARDRFTDRELASLRRACVHEAGHLVICNACGDRAKARIWRAADGTWAGQVKPARWPYSDPRATRTVGLAGTVAVLLDHGIGADTTFNLLAAGELRLSAQDAPIAAGYTWADVRDVAAMLRRDWDQVLAMADRIARTA
jgi:hypothetical protein